MNDLIKENRRKGGQREGAAPGARAEAQAERRRRIKGELLLACSRNGQLTTQSLALLLLLLLNLCFDCMRLVSKTKVGRDKVVLDNPAALSALTS